MVMKRWCFFMRFALFAVIMALVANCPYMAQAAEEGDYDVIVVGAGPGV